jgi:hypothetical protein
VQPSSFVCFIISSEVVGRKVVLLPLVFSNVIKRFCDRWISKVLHMVLLLLSENNDKLRVLSNK